jgi:hypothetical protein
VKNNILNRSTDYFFAYLTGLYAIIQNKKGEEKMKALPKEYIGMELSNATMRSEDLIPSFLYFLEQVAKECEIEDEVQAIQEEVAKLEFEEKSGYGTYYKNEDEASWILNEDIWELLNSIAPQFCYFGANEGDGACYGFWTSDEALSDYVDTELSDLQQRNQEFTYDFEDVRSTLDLIMETLNEHDR